VLLLMLRMLLPVPHTCIPCCCACLCCCPRLFLQQRLMQQLLQDGPCFIALSCSNVLHCQAVLIQLHLQYMTYSQGISKAKRCSVVLGAVPASDA
jgi:hypothetical protein